MRLAVLQFSGGARRAGRALAHNDVITCQAHHRVSIAGVLIEQPSPHRQLIQLVK